MTDKNCILYDNRICNNCGECDTCDIDSNKKCDNCGKCLELFDYTGIQIDDLLLQSEDGDIEKEYSGDSWKFKEIEINNSDNDNDSNIVFIDDVDGLNEKLEQEDNHNHN